MTKQEFIERSRTVVRVARRSFVTWLGLLSLAVLALMVIVGIPLLELIYEPWQTPAYYGVLACLILVNILLMDWRTRRILRKHGLVCPKCGTLFGEGLRRFAITTGTCGRCGTELFTA